MGKVKNHFHDEIQGTDGPGPADTFQQRAQHWLLECLGTAEAADIHSRNHRFLEEALELVQAGGCTAADAHTLVDYVYGRPLGEVDQEVGGVMVALAMLCSGHYLDMTLEGERQLARANTPEIMARVRRKNATKPNHSPLPGKG